MLSVVKSDLQKYCDTSHSKNSVNQLWIRKKSKQLLKLVISRALSFCNRVKHFTLYLLYHLSDCNPTIRLKEF